MTTKKCRSGKHKGMPNMEHEAKEAYGTVHGMGHGGLKGLQGMISGFKKKPRM